MIPYCSICWDVDKVKLLDQRRLPAEELYMETRDYHDVIEAIRTLAIRGAPAIGVAAAMGAALGALSLDTRDGKEFQSRFQDICREIAAARPTAVNLFWALDRVLLVAQDHAAESGARPSRTISWPKPRPCSRKMTPPTAAWPRRDRS